MRRNVKIFITMACLALSITTILTMGASLKTLAEPDTPLLEPEEAQLSVALPVGGEYLVKEANGYVAVYLANQPDAVVEMTDIRVGALRLADQEMLRQGVVLQGTESLWAFLEDFLP